MNVFGSGGLSCSSINRPPRNSRAVSKRVLPFDWLARRSCASVAELIQIRIDVPGTKIWVDGRVAIRASINNDATTIALNDKDKQILSPIAL